MKKRILASLVQQLEAELANLDRATKAALDAATSEESKPENQYDTRALEASYLAAAQGKRLQDLKATIETLRNFPLVDSPAIVGSGALVETECEGTNQWYFLLPFGAGLNAKEGEVKASVVTLESPLGRLLNGRRAGDSFELVRAGSTRVYEILQVL